MGRQPVQILGLGLSWHSTSFVRKYSILKKINKIIIALKIFPKVERNAGNRNSGI